MIGFVCVLVFGEGRGLLDFRASFFGQGKGLIERYEMMGMLNGKQIWYLEIL